MRVLGDDNAIDFSQPGNHPPARHRFLLDLTHDPQDLSHGLIFQDDPPLRPDRAGRAVLWVRQFLGSRCASTPAEKVTTTPG
jgi:hypothetical protein